MDRKQKVKELIESYLVILYGVKKLYKKHEIEKSKQCILKLVEQVKKSCAYYDYNIKEEYLETSVFSNEFSVTYWEELKQEIENYE